MGRGRKNKNPLNSAITRTASPLRNTLQALSPEAALRVFNRGPAAWNSLLLSQRDAKADWAPDLALFDWAELPETIERYDFTGCNFDKASLNKKVFKDCNLTNTEFSKSHYDKLTFDKCTGIDSSSLCKPAAYLVRVKFENCHLANIDWDDVALFGTKFIKCKMQKNSFNKAELDATEFNGCDLEGGDFKDCEIEHVKFIRSNLIGATLTSSNFNDCSFENTKLRQANFTNSTLEGCNFHKAKLLATKFHNTKIVDTFFEKAISANSSFIGAVFEHTNFNDTIFKETDFSKTKFIVGQIKNSKQFKNNYSDASFRNTNCKGSDFADSIFAKTSFDYTRQLYVEEGWAKTLVNGVDLSTVELKNHANDIIQLKHQAGQ